MWNKLVVLAACVVFVCSGLVHGWWTDRWQTAQAVVATAAKLEQVPMTIGPWRGRTLALDQDDMARAGYAGSLWRLYEHEPTGAVVSVLLVCGRPGPVSVHTPDACYGGAGFTMLDEPARIVIRPPALSRPAEFWQTRFAAKNAALEKQLRICWSWNADGSWHAAEHPRRAFSHLPVLVKLYVVSEVPLADAGRKQDDVCAEFTSLLLPELEKLFPKMQDE